VREKIRGYPGKDLDTVCSFKAYSGYLRRDEKYTKKCKLESHQHEDIGYDYYRSISKNERTLIRIVVCRIRSKGPRMKSKGPSTIQDRALREIMASRSNSGGRVKVIVTEFSDKTTVIDARTLGNKLA
jgi:hypothetical protein